MNDITLDGNFFSDLKEAVSFFIVRHGETFANAEIRIQGRSEYELTDKGKKQAKILGRFLSDKNINKIIHSTLKRAVQTANILKDEISVQDVIPNKEFVELETGVFTGLTFPEIKEKYPKIYEQFRYNSWEVVPNAESAEQLYNRAIRAWTIIKEEAKNTKGNIAVVTHGGMIQWLVRSTFGCRTWFPYITTGNCSVFEFYVEPRGLGVPAYIRWNEINKIPDELKDTVPAVF